MTPEEFYDSNRKLFENLTLRLEDEIKILLHDPVSKTPRESIEIMKIESRPKGRESFLNKINIKRVQYAERNLGFSYVTDVDDYIAARVIHYRKSDQDRIKRIIEAGLIASPQQREVPINQFGYQALHLRVEIPPEWIPKEHGNIDFTVLAEIQISTVAMHLWSYLSKKVFHKHENLLTDLEKRQLYKLSALCEVVDDIYEELSKKGE